MKNPASRGSNLVFPDWQAIVELRSRRGWTQEKLAEKSILSVRTIQNLERGKSIHLGTIAKIADALGIKASECIAASIPSPEIKAGSTTIGSSLPTCPYRGLLAFHEEDADLFFGREVLIDLLKDRLARKNIIQVSGGSGSGKSSLIAAGLIPSLRRSASWHVIYCRPGADPFGALASAMMPYVQPGVDDIKRAAQLPSLREVLEQGQLGYLLQQILLNSKSAGLLLFIDQFEELYTQCTAQLTRNRFLDTLASLASTGSAIKFVYTIRADFSNRLLSHRRFTDEIQDSDLKIGPMIRGELDLIIRKPAMIYNVQFENGLVERILNDAGAESGTLPLLEFALTELWSGQANGQLTHSAYEGIGQLSGAIAQRAEKIYRSLTSPQQEAARHILTRLVRLADEGGEDTKQRIPLSALYSEELLNRDSGRRVVAVLTEARLVTVGMAGTERQELIEIAHEALVRRWPRLSQWLQEDRDILMWRQRLRTIMGQWEQTGRDDGFLLRGSLLDDARLWLSRRSNNITPEEKDFIVSSLALKHRERLSKPIGRLELLVDSPVSEQEWDSESAVTATEKNRILRDLPFFGRPGTFRLQINIVPVATEHGENIRSKPPHLPFRELIPVFSAATPANLPYDDDSDLSSSLKAGHKLDDQTFALLRDLQMRGSSGLALELLNPQLDGISDPKMRLRFASIVFDMMHVRGRYADATELIRQELSLHAQSSDVHSPLLLTLKIRLVHHQMFYRPVTELWAQMVDLLASSECAQDPDCYGEILFMLGGNLGTLRGDYREARRFLVRATRHAMQHKDQYLLARCLRKYGDMLRFEGHLHLAKTTLLEAFRLSARGRGTRQRIYILGCLGDLERQMRNYSAASEYFDRGIELARSTFIPGWLGNLHLGLAELAFERTLFDDAKTLLEQAEAHFRNTHPRHWWGSIQVNLGHCRLKQASGDSDWMDRARMVHREATWAGYAKDAASAAMLLKGEPRAQNVLMFL